MPARLPELIALPVPWCISMDGDGEIEVEVQAGKPISIRFMAYFELLEPPDIYVGKATMIVPDSTGDPSRFVRLSTDGFYKHRLVRVSFSDGVLYRRTLHLPDRGLDDDAFDWSGVPAGKFDPDEPEDVSIDKWSRYWKTHGVCPDPFAYEVQRSPWLAELGDSAVGLRHYLFGVYDYVVDVVARDCTWALDKALE